MKLLFVILMLVPGVLLAKTDKEMMRESIRTNLNKFRKCYDEARIAKPKLEGKVNLYWKTKGPDVVEARIASSTLNDKKAEACILEELKKIKFTKVASAEEVEVNTYPIIFQHKK